MAKAKAKVKRAIALAGGGPVAGLHIGALRRLNEADIDFDVWALSCIGAWVGIVHNQFREDKHLRKTEAFFRDGVFRGDLSYARFPINGVFGTDWTRNWIAFCKYVMDPKSYDLLWLPSGMALAMKQAWEYACDPDKWNDGNRNDLILELLSANPFVRYYASMMYQAKIDGLSRIYYPESRLLSTLDFEELEQPSKPFIYHNAWNLSKKRLEQFANKPDKLNAKYDDDRENRYRRMSPQSLCACSALPFVEQTVKIGRDVYCEGALIDTVNLKRLLVDHDLDEIWISRIVDDAQVAPPDNLHDALANLCQLFAATVGEDDIDLFEYRVKDLGWKGKIIKLEVHPHMNFDWTHSNLDQGIRSGYEAADKKLRDYVRPFPEARELVHKLCLATEDHWKRLVRSKELPDGAPHNPAIHYQKDGWNGMQDWLGLQ